MQPLPIAYFNGEFVAFEDVSISPLDRGFLFADGVYEVIPVYEGKVFALSLHLQRLSRSLEALRLDSGISKADWEEIIKGLVDRNGGGNQSVYLQVTRGPVAARDHTFPDKKVQPTVFIMSAPAQSSLAIDITELSGVKAVTVKDIRWHRCDIKSISLLPNILLRQQAKEAGAHEAIMIRDGKLTEGAATNVFVIHEGRIRTPLPDDNILSGITRDILLKIALDKGLCVEEGTVTEEDLRSADEIWLTSSTRELMPVVELDGLRVGLGQAGPVWRRMADYFQQYKYEALFPINGGAD